MVSAENPPARWMNVACVMLAPFRKGGRLLAALTIGGRDECTSAHRANAAPFPKGGQCSVVSASRRTGGFSALKFLSPLLFALLTNHANANNDAMFEPLEGRIGDAKNGRAIVANRQLGLCILCHQVPIPEAQFQGDLATNLAGAGSRWTTAQLRMRIVDARELNPQTIMPSYYRATDLTRVGAQWQGRTVLSAQQIEDVVAYLETLK